MSTRTRVTLGRREDLGGDCANCFGLCCTALAFARSVDFPIDKPAGDPCLNLDEHDGCRIHSHLRTSGFKGCTVFDCFGAGQRVSQHTFAGRSWRDDTVTRAQMFAVFPLMRRLHELLWYLDCALALPVTDEARLDLGVEFGRTLALTLGTANEVLESDVDAYYEQARPLLIDASATARAGHPTAVSSRRIRAGAELPGADLAHTDLRGTDLRGALLIGADLTGADLRWCDLLGADLRDANLAGADLSEAIYLTQVQVGSARGDADTRLPDSFDRPSHWS
jgi:hypothetical protein